MDDNRRSQQLVSFNVPVTVIVGVIAAALIGLAVYVALGGSRGERSNSAAKSSKGGGKIGRKVGLTTLIALLENDLTRKVVLAALKAIARRS